MESNVYIIHICREMEAKIDIILKSNTEDFADGSSDDYSASFGTGASFIEKICQRITAAVESPSPSSSEIDEFDDMDVNLDEDEDSYSDSGEDFWSHRVTHPKVSKNPSPDTSKLDRSDYKLQFTAHTQPPSSICNLIHKRENGRSKRRTYSNFSAAEQHYIGDSFIPNKKVSSFRYRDKAFCGTFSKDGDIFVTAGQDRKIRLYNAQNNVYNLYQVVQAREMGWSILDTAFSPDKRHLIYSSWCDSLFLCNITGDSTQQEKLWFSPDRRNSFCIFSCTFSSDNREILAGANNGYMYLYDIEANCSRLAIDAHDHDVNAVAFADESSQILFSGSDDGLLKAWDRRTLSESNPVPVGTMAGHCDGITFIDSKGDGRHLISNSKDQTIKLWDIRYFSSRSAQEATKKEASRQNWDYRWQQVPRNMLNVKKSLLQGDTSLMTYRGHAVLHTLIRARFSPRHTTGQRYIYSGCATGAVIVYDSLTGTIVSQLSGHNACVRDVYWHPYQQTLMSTSWDTTIGRWDYVETMKETPEKPEKMKCCRLSSKNKLLTGSYAKLKLALRDFRN